MAESDVHMRAAMGAKNFFEALKPYKGDLPKKTKVEIEEEPKPKRMRLSRKTDDAETTTAARADTEAKEAEAKEAVAKGAVAKGEDPKPPKAKGAAAKGAAAKAKGAEPQPPPKAKGGSKGGKAKGAALAKQSATPAPAADRHSEDSKANKAAYGKLNYSLKKMAEGGKSEHLEEFKALSVKDKQGWVSKFKVDPTMAWLEASTETTVGIEKHNHEQIVKLTPEQLGGPMYLNSEEHASILISSGWLTTKPHELKPLADAGVVQVEWSTKWKTLDDFFKDQSSVKATGEVSKDDYEKVTSAMTKDWGIATQKKTPTKNSTPDEELKKKAEKEKSKLLAQAQTVVTSYKAKISAATIDPLLVKVQARPWGKDVAPVIEKEVETINTMIEELHAAWAAETLVVKTESHKFDKAKIDNGIKKVEKAYGDLDTKWLADIRSLK